MYNPPLNGVISIRNTPLLSFVPIKGGVLYPGCTAQLVAANSPCSIYSPGGVEPNFHTPTIQQWSFTIERQLTKDLLLRVGYIGSEDYHMMINMDMNIPIPLVCNNPAGCLNASGGVGTVRGTPAFGTTYVPFSPTSPTNSGMANPFVSNTYSWFFAGVNRYHAANVSLVKRVSAGLGFKANYSFSKLIDDMSANTGSTGANEPYLIWNRYNIGLNKGSAAFNLRHQFSANFSYELPFGAGKASGSGATGVWDKVISGWQWNGIISAQGGFPTTPQVGRNISGTGDTRNPDVPDFNPAFTGPIVRNNPTAFSLPIPGTFGNAGRGAIRGPELTSMDTSFFKKIPLSERFNLQFRAEMFNILNHTNFGNPNPIVFSGNAYSATAGVISKTATTARQIQFALRLTF